MSIDDEIAALEKHLRELAAETDEQLYERYKMRRPTRPAGLYWQLRWLAGSVLRSLQAAGLIPAHPWPVSLAHSRKGRGSKPVLLWAVGTDSTELRVAIHSLSRLVDDIPDYVPVLVTDVAEFAHYSRLGWLVEYLPTIEGDGEPYCDRKARFIARLYRGAPAVPAHALAASEQSLLTLRRYLYKS